MDNKLTQRFYLPELDGLRFFAFLLVFFNHAPYFIENEFSKTLQAYGWMGVDIFLCLSAFLITKLLIEEYDQAKNINYRYFFIRRALKIWPLYYAFLMFCLVYSVKNQIDGFSWARLLGLLTFTDNILSAAFTQYNHFFATVHLWTISYEEQVYIILPFLTLFLIKLGVKKRFLFLLASIVLGNIIRAFFILSAIGHPAIWVFPLTHFESVTAGIAIAFIRPANNASTSRYWLFFLTGVMCLIAATSLPNIENTTWSLMMTYPMVGIGVGLIVISISSGRIKIVSGFLSQKIIAYLGKISYGLYVFHLMALYMTDYLYKFISDGRNSFFYTGFMMVVGLLITILFSTASHAWIEKPFLRKKRKYTIVQSRPV